MGLEHWLKADALDVDELSMEVLLLLTNVYIGEERAMRGEVGRVMMWVVGDEVKGVRRLVPSRSRSPSRAP